MKYFYVDFSSWTIEAETEQGAIDKVHKFFAENKVRPTISGVEEADEGAEEKEFINLEAQEETPLDIQVQRIYRFESDRPLKAFADIIINDALLIKGVKVLEYFELGEDTPSYKVVMPQEQAKDKKWYDSVRCLTQEVKEHITAKVLEVYNEK